MRGMRCGRIRSRGKIMEDTCELTILMPCLNESETLATCIMKAKAYLWSVPALTVKCW